MLDRQLLKRILSDDGGQHMHACLVLAHDPGKVDALQGPIALLGPGTGLGQANLFWDDSPSSPNSGYRVYPSEGSHAGFAPRGWRQRALQARLLSVNAADVPGCRGSALWVVPCLSFVLLRRLLLSRSWDAAALSRYVQLLTLLSATAAGSAQKAVLLERHRADMPTHALLVVSSSTLDAVVSACT